MLRTAFFAEAGAAGLAGVLAKHGSTRNDRTVIMMCFFQLTDRRT